MYLCPRCGSYSVCDEGFPEGQESLFYSTIDESCYVEYFRPFRSSQYRHVLGKLAPGSGRAHLDIGTSYGWMVEVGLDLGLDSYGIEPGDARYDPLVDGRILRTSLHDYWRKRTRQFDVVTAWHVLEHFPEPLAALRQMRDLLADGGSLVLAVPTSSGRMFQLAVLLYRALGSQRLIDELFYSHNPNMHFTYPNLASLAFMLQQADLEVVQHETMESFDWTTIWKRAHTKLSRGVLKWAGPALKMSGFTRAENLVVVSRKRVRSTDEPPPGPVL